MADLAFFNIHLVFRTVSKSFQNDEIYQNLAWLQNKIILEWDIVEGHLIRLLEAQTSLFLNIEISSSFSQHVLTKICSKQYTSKTSSTLEKILDHSCIIMQLDVYQFLMLFRQYINLCSIVRRYFTSYRYNCLHSKESNMKKIENNITKTMNEKLSFSQNFHVCDLKRDFNSHKSISFLTVHREESAQETSFERVELVQFLGCCFCIVFVWALDWIALLIDRMRTPCLMQYIPTLLRSTRLADVHYSGDISRTRFAKRCGRRGTWRDNAPALKSPRVPTFPEGMISSFTG